MRPAIGRASAARLRERWLGPAVSWVVADLRRRRYGADLLAVLALGRAQTLLLDKTGTLTGGRQEVSDLVCAPGVTAEEMLAVAAGKILARPRRHAVGGSIWRAWCG